MKKIQFPYMGLIKGSLIIVAIFAFAGSAHAETAVVTDQITLEAALADPNIDTITIDSSFSVTAKEIISRPLTIDGQNNTISFTGIIPTTWGGNYVFEAYNANDVILKDIKLTGGNAGFLANGSNVTLSGEIDVSGNGFGGIESSAGSVTTVSDAEFTNSTEGYGLPTIWEDGTTGTTVVGFTGTTNTTIKPSQIQYYLNEDNTADIVNISNADELTSAISNQRDGQIWNITADITTNAQINISKAITVEGNSKTISAAFSGINNDNNSVINITGNNVTLKNLIEDGGSASDTPTTGNRGINIYRVTGILLDNVTAKNNSKNGIVINGSVATANNVTTSGNGWEGIDVDKGSLASLTINGVSSHSEAKSAIRIDDISSGNYTVVDTEHQYSYIDTGVARDYYLLEADQTTPDESGEATVTETNTKVVVTSASTPITISAGSVTNAKVDFSSLVSAGSGTVPKTTVTSNIATVVIPATTITSADTAWDGTITLPKVVEDAVKPTVASGKIANVIKSIEVGFGDTQLSLDAPAKLVFPGESGSMIGWSQGGHFQLIEDACQFAEGEEAPTLEANADCRQIVGSDLVVWTRHFTTFTTYTEASAPTTNSSVSSSSGSSRRSAEVSVTATNTPAPQIGEVLGAETVGPEIQTQINTIKSQLIVLISQLITLLQAEVAAQS